MTIEALLGAGLGLLAPFAVGLLLGFVFFGGLWLTVRQLGTTKRPGLLFAVSFVARTAVVLAGIYWIGAGQWQRMAASLVGLIVMRTIVTRRWGPLQIAKADGPTG